MWFDVQFDTFELVLIILIGLVEGQDEAKPMVSPFYCQMHLGTLLTACGSNLMDQ